MILFMMKKMSIAMMKMMSMMMMKMMKMMMLVRKTKEGWSVVRWEGNI